MLTLNFMSKLRGLAPLALRAAIGVAFFWFHGRDKVMPDGGWDWGQSWVAEDRESAPPAVLLYIAAWTEFLGGFAVLLGLFTRLAALGLLGVMAFAIFKIHVDDPYEKMELALAYAAGCLALLCVGPGSVSLDRLFFGKEVVEQ